MATIDTLVYTFQRGLSFNVQINGVTLLPNAPLTDAGTPALESIRFNKSFDSPVPVAELSLSHLPTWIVRGQTVTVDLGYNGINSRIFTGFVQDRSRKVAKCTVRAMGKSYSLYRTVQIGQRDVTGQDVGTAIRYIMQAMGNLAWNEVNGLHNTYVLGQAPGASIKLEKMPASQMVQMLADIDGSRIWETNDGTINIGPIEFVPAPNAVWTYSTQSQASAIVIDGSDREDPEYFRDKVLVTGATVAATATTASSTLTASATLTNSGGLVQPPLGIDPVTGLQTHIEMEYSNHLIDSQTTLQTLALLLLNRFARIPRYLTLEIAGDPRVDLGMTVELNFPEMGIADSRWFVHGIEHTIDATQGFKTRLMLRGGDQIGGTADLDPIAAFVVAQETEVMGGIVQTIFNFDASTSYDPDGSIVSWVWTFNQGVASVSGKNVTVAANTTGWTGDFVVTLTVTDNLGNTATLSKVVPYGTNVAVTIPAIYGALSNRISASPDGGVTWYDIALSTAVSVDAKPANGVSSGIACYGFTNGVIRRTTDSAQSSTQVSTTDGTQVNHVWWDKNLTSRVWACTTGGQLWKSDDDGVTWAVYKNFGGTYPINRIATPAPNGVWVFGGRGDQTSTLIQFDASVNNAWQSASVGGQLAADIAGASSSVTIADAASHGGRLSVIFKGAALPGGVSIFSCPGDQNDAGSIFGTGANWVRAIGLTAGLLDGRFIVPDATQDTFHAGFSDRNVWHTTDGVNYTQSANVFPANTVPWHALWFGAFLGNYPGAHMVALEDTVTPNNGYLVKSIDALASIVNLRPVTGISTWPAASKGKQIAVGAPGGTVETFGQLLRSDTNQIVQAFDGISHWASLGTVGAGTHSPHSLISLGGGHMVVVDDLGDTGELWHSSDNAANWTKVISNNTAGNDSGVCGMDVSPDGTIWVVYGSFSSTSGGEITDPLIIKKSTDHGASFVDVYTDPGWSGGGGITNGNTTVHNMNNALTADKWDPNNIFIVTRGLFNLMPDSIYSIDGGATWTRRINPTTDVPRISAGGDTIQFVNNHRIIYMQNKSSPALYYSPDYGATWTLCTIPSMTGRTAGRLGAYKALSSNRIIFTATAVVSARVYISEDNGSTFTEISGIGDLGFVSISQLYDILGDVIYAGGSVDLVKITPVFSGTPVKTVIDFDMNTSDANGSYFLEIKQA